MALSFQRPWFSFLLILLPLCSLRQAVRADTDLKNAWDIQGPIGKKCLVTGSDVDAAPTESDISSTVCDDSSSAIRLEYTIHKNAKYPKYKIFQKGCEEVFDIGTEPVRGSMSPGEDNRTALVFSPASYNDDTVTATLEILPTKDSLSSPWWRRMSNTELKQHTVEFCIRMGLWLPPQAGNMEVNFRETNFVVTFNKTSDDDNDNDKSEESDRDESSDYFVDSVTVNPKELVHIAVNLMGATASTVKGKIEKNDEL